MTMARDQAVHRDEAAVQEILKLKNQLECTNTGYQNCEDMLRRMVVERNEA